MWHMGGGSKSKTNHKKAFLCPILTLCRSTDLTPYTPMKSSGCVTGLPLHCVFVCEKHGVTVSDTHLQSFPFPPQMSEQRQLGWEDAAGTTNFSGAEKRVDKEMSLPYIKLHVLKYTGP